MGGPMGAYDEKKYDWLASEKQLIKNAIRCDKTVIGICLGAQLIAQVLGAKVYPNQHKEIGWFPIQLSDEAIANKLFKGLSKTLTVFHWHGDMFDLPTDATHVASSKACKNQAFLYNEKVIGLQFHFEMTEAALQKMIENGNEELVPGSYVPTAERSLNNRNLIENNKRVLFDLLDRLASQ
jgi:GMP synthase-like glutamine amidotransferase